MRHTSRRRTFVDPLAPQPTPTWLVVRDRTQCVLESRELVSGADLRVVLASAKDVWSAAGWSIEPMGPASSGFFCSRAGERVYVGIDRADPQRPILR